MVEKTTVVVGCRVVQFEFERLDDRTIDVVVSEEGRRWNFREADWVSLSYGIAADCLYWWSARRLVIMPPDAVHDVQTVEVEEDIRFVFRLRRRWLLICETSARLWSAGSETARLDFSDVVTGARWEKDALVVSVWGTDAVALLIEDERFTFSRGRRPEDGPAA